MNIKEDWKRATTQEKQKLIEELWQKYAYEITGGYRSDRSKIIADYIDITGENITTSTLSNYTQKMDLEYLYATRNDPEHIRHSVSDDGSITSSIRQRMSEKRVFTNRELLELHAINPDENVIDRIVSNEWSMTNADGDTYFNFQSKIIAKPIVANQMTLEEFREIVRVEPKVMKIETKGIGIRHLVVGLADLHFPVTRLEDLKEEMAEVMGIMENGYDIIVFEQLGDLFESSQMKASVTLAGTILPTADMAVAWQEAKSFYHTLIDHALMYCNKVQIEHACGNHSGNMEYPFMDGLKDRYSLLEEKKVEVNLHNDYRTAYRIGNIGIMLSHGDTVPLAKLPLKFASEYPLLWGDVEHRECHTGHKHNNFKEVDIDGTVMRQYPTPKPSSDYEDKFGYNSRKFIQLVEYNNDKSKGTYEIG